MPHDFLKHSYLDLKRNEKTFLETKLLGTS